MNIPEEALRNLIDIFCENTELSVGIVDLETESIVSTRQSYENMPTLCKILWSTGYGKSKCRSSHITRARKIEKNELTMCHAGLTNLAIPISIDNNRVAVLLCGQRRPVDKKATIKASRAFKSLMGDYGKQGADNDYEYADIFPMLYERIPATSKSQLQKITNKLLFVSNWMCWAHEELEKINKEKAEIKAQKDRTLQSAVFLIHDMAEQLQRVLDAASILHQHSTSQPFRKAQVKGDCHFLKTELSEAVKALKRIHSQFSMSVKENVKYDTTELPKLINRETLSRLLDLFCESTGLAIGLFERDEAKRVILSECAEEHFTLFCRAVWELPEGKRLCETDHVSRANELEVEGLSHCWAGLHNYGMPISVDGHTVAALLCGQRRIDDENMPYLGRYCRLLLKARSIEKEEEGRVAKDIAVAYEDIPIVPDKFIHVDKFKNMALLLSWMYDNHEQYRKSVEERKEIISRYDNILHEEILVYHDIVQLALQSMMVIFDSIHSSSNNTFSDSPMELGRCSGDILDILDGSRHRLRFSKIAQYAWNTKEDKDEINLIALIRRCVAELGECANRKNVVFVIDEARVNIIIRVNYYDLYIAFWNVLHNAVKYSHKGFHRMTGMKVNISMRIDEYNRCCVEIENFGVGILEHENARIYKSGERGTLAKEERPEGAGRGLYEAYDCLSRNNCAIWHNSRNQGEGRYLTAFYIEIPIHEIRRLQ